MARVTPCIRSELQYQPVASAVSIGEIKRALSMWERLSNVTVFRRALILIGIAVLWQLYAAHLDNPLLFPTFGSVVKAFTSSIKSGDLTVHVWNSLTVLVKGYAAGVIVAILLTTLAVSSRFGSDLLATLTGMLNPLPAIALLPLALLWFGLGDLSIIFVLIHAVLWPMVLNTHSGFLSVSRTLRMVGRNSGVSGTGYVVDILIPAAFPSILAGLKISWAFAWRTLIAAELVFGQTSGSGGLGWFIFEHKNDLDIPAVFAGLAAVTIIGLLVDNLLFKAIEIRTVNKWGMQN